MVPARCLRNSFLFFTALWVMVQEGFFVSCSPQRMAQGFVVPSMKPVLPGRAVPDASRCEHPEVPAVKTIRFSS